MRVCISYFSQCVWLIFYFFHTRCRGISYPAPLFQTLLTEWDSHDLAEEKFEEMKDGNNFYSNSLRCFLNDRNLFGVATSQDPMHYFENSCMFKMKILLSFASKNHITIVNKHLWNQLNIKELTLTNSAKKWRKIFLSYSYVWDPAIAEFVGSLELHSQLREKYAFFLRIMYLSGFIIIFLYSKSSERTATNFLRFAVATFIVISLIIVEFERKPLLHEHVL